MRVDFLVLADSAQVAGDKLYLLGGGWRFIQATSFPLQHQMGLAIGILVDWHDANHRYPFAVEIRNDDTAEVLHSITGEFEVGRPPGLPAGAEIRMLMAFNFALPLAGPGALHARAILNGQEAAKTTFSAMLRP